MFGREWMMVLMHQKNHNQKEHVWQTINMQTETVVNTHMGKIAFARIVYLSVAKRAPISLWRTTDAAGSVDWNATNICAGLVDASYAV